MTTSMPVAPSHEVLSIEVTDVFFNHVDWICQESVIAPVSVKPYNLG